MTPPIDKIVPLYLFLTGQIINSISPTFKHAAPNVTRHLIYTVNPSNLSRPFIKKTIINHRAETLYHIAQQFRGFHLSLNLLRLFLNFRSLVKLLQPYVQSIPKFHTSDGDLHSDGSIDISSSQIWWRSTNRWFNRYQFSKDLMEIYTYDSIDGRYSLMQIYTHIVQ